MSVSPLAEAKSERVPHRLHYVARKAAVSGMARAIAREGGEFGLAGNAVTPGPT